MEQFSAPNIPEEIIREILLRLPVKPLLKFRCVSKLWCLLISSSHFAKAHLKLSTKNKTINAHHDKLLYGSKNFPIDLYTCSLKSVKSCSGYVYPTNNANLHVDRVLFDYPYNGPDDEIRLVGSCNGLVCVSISDTTLILWNPLTRKSRVLPNSGTRWNDFIWYQILFGFGYDELHDDYKVVEVMSFNRYMCEVEMQVKVYSLRTNSWKILSNWPGGEPFGGSGIFLNGAFHWSVTSYIDEDGLDWDIVSHDLSTDTFAYIPLPDIENYDVRVEMKILGGCLSACCEHDTYMDLWVMKEYGVKSSWTKIVHFPFHVDLNDNFVRPSPLFMMPDGKMIINYGSTLRIYDLRNPRIHHFGKNFEVEAITYVETLVSPDLDG